MSWTEVIIGLFLILAGIALLSIPGILYDRRLQRQLDRDIAHYSALMEYRNQRRGF